MSELLQFFKDMRDNGYGLAEIAAQLGTSAIAEPVAGFAAMYDPVHGAAAIREGMTYTPRTEAGQMYRQGAARTLGTIAQPAMPVIDAWQRGVDVAGKYSPVTGAALQTVPTALGALMGYKPAMQTGRQVSNSLGAMQGRMVANANAPRTLNAGYMGQRGATQLHLFTPEILHATAQQRSALPVNQGGLGLAPDNTAMDRARAMGYNIDDSYYHGGNVIDAHKSSIETNSPFDGFFLSRDKEAAASHGKNMNEFLVRDSRKIKDFTESNASYKSYIKHLKERFPHAKKSEIEKVLYPLIVEDKDIYNIMDMTGLNEDKILSLIRESDIGEASWAMQNERGVLAKKLGYDLIGMKDEHGQSYFTPNGSLVRRKDAAFDPFYRDSSNLLAQSAKLAPTTALGAYMYNEKRKKSQGKQ